MSTIKNSNSSKNIVYLRKNPPQQEQNTKKSLPQQNQQAFKNIESSQNRKNEQDRSQQIDFQKNDLKNQVINMKQKYYLFNHQELFYQQNAKNNTISEIKDLSYINSLQFYSQQNQKNGAYIKMKQKLLQSSSPFIHNEGDDYSQQKEEMQKLLEQEESNSVEHTLQYENQILNDDQANIQKKNENIVKSNIGIIILSNSEIQQDKIKHVYFIVISQQEETIKDHFEFTISSEEDGLQDLQDHFKLISRKIDFFQNNSEESFIIIYSSKRVKNFLKQFNLNFLEHEVNKEAIYMDQIIPEKYKLENSDICNQTLIDDLELNKDASLIEKTKILSYFNNQYSTQLIQLIFKFISKELFITRDLSSGWRERNKFQKVIMNEVKSIKNSQINIQTQDENQINDKQENLQCDNEINSKQNINEKLPNNNCGGIQLQIDQPKYCIENNNIQSISKNSDNSIQNIQQSNTSHEINQQQYNFSNTSHQKEESSSKPIQQEQYIQINKDQEISQDDQYNKQTKDSIINEYNINIYSPKNTQPQSKEEIKQQQNDTQQNLNQLTNQLIKQEIESTSQQKQNDQKDQIIQQENQNNDFQNDSSSIKNQSELKKSKHSLQNKIKQDNFENFSRQLNYEETANSNKVQSMASVNRDKRYENEDFDLIFEIKKEIQTTNQLTEMNKQLKQTIEVQTQSQQELIQNFTSQQQNIFESVKTKQKMMLDLFIKFNEETEQILTNQTEQMQQFSQKYQKNNQAQKIGLLSEIQKSNEQIQSHSQILETLVLKVQQQEESKQFELQQQQQAIQDASRLLMDCSQALLIRNPMMMSQIRDNMNQQSSLNQSNSQNNLQSGSQIFGGYTANNIENKQTNIQNSQQKNTSQQNTNNKLQNQSLQSSFQSLKPNLQNQEYDIQPQIQFQIIKDNQINYDNNIDKNQQKIQINNKQFDMNLQNLNINQQQLDTNLKQINSNQQQKISNQDQTNQRQIDRNQNKLELNQQNFKSNIQNIDQEVSQQKTITMNQHIQQNQKQTQRVDQQISNTFVEQYSNKHIETPTQTKNQNSQNQQINKQQQANNSNNTKINKKQTQQQVDNQKKQIKGVENQQIDFSNQTNRQIQKPNNQTNGNNSIKNHNNIKNNNYIENKNEIVINLEFQETPTEGQEQNDNEGIDRDHQSSVSNLSSIAPNEFINEQQSELVQNNFNDFQFSDQKQERDIIEVKPKDIQNNNFNNNHIVNDIGTYVDKQMNQEKDYEKHVNQKQFKEDQTVISQQIKGVYITPIQNNKENISNFDSASQLNQYQIESNELSSNIKSSSQNSDDLLKQKDYSSNFNSQTIKSSENISSEFISQTTAKKALLLKKLKNQQVETFKLHTNQQIQQIKEKKDQNQSDTQNQLKIFEFQNEQNSHQQLQQQHIQQQQLKQQKQSENIFINHQELIPTATSCLKNNIQNQNPTKNLFTENSQIDQDLISNLNFFKKTSNNIRNETSQPNALDIVKNNSFQQNTQNWLSNQPQQILLVDNKSEQKNLQNTLNIFGFQQDIFKQQQAENNKSQKETTSNVTVYSQNNIFSNNPAQSLFTNKQSQDLIQNLNFFKTPLNNLENEQQTNIQNQVNSIQQNTQNGLATQSQQFLQSNNNNQTSKNLQQFIEEQQKKQGDSIKDLQDSFMSSHNTSQISKQDNSILNIELFEQPKKSIFEGNNFIQAIFQQQQEISQRLLEKQNQEEISQSNDTLNKAKQQLDIKNTKEQLNLKQLGQDKKVNQFSPQQSDQDECKNNNSMNDLVNDIQQKMNINSNKYGNFKNYSEFDELNTQKQTINNIISEENNQIQVKEIQQKESNKILNLHNNQYNCKDKQTLEKEDFKDTFITQIKYSQNNEDLNEFEQIQNKDENSEKEENDYFQECDNSDDDEKDEQISKVESISEQGSQNQEGQEERITGFYVKGKTSNQQEIKQQKQNRNSKSLEKSQQFFTSSSSPQQQFIKQTGQNQAPQMSQQFSVNQLNVSSSEVKQKYQYTKSVQENKNNNSYPNNNRNRYNKQTSQSNERNYSANKYTSNLSRSNQNKQNYHQLQRSQSSQPNNKRVPIVEYVQKNSDITLKKRSESEYTYSETPTQRGTNDKSRIGISRNIDERIEEEEKLNSSIISRATEAEYNNIYELIKPKQRMSPKDITKTIQQNTEEISNRLQIEKIKEQQQLNIQINASANTNINQKDNSQNDIDQIAQIKLKSTVQMLIVTRFTTNQNRSEVIEMNVIIVNTDRHQIIDEFHEFVRPQDTRIPTEVIKLITIKKAHQFDQVFAKMCNFLKPYLDNYKCCILYESDFDAQLIHSEFVHKKIIPSTSVFEVFYTCILLTDIFPPSLHKTNQPIKNLHQAFIALGLKHESKKNRRMEEIRSLARVATELLQKGVTFCSKDKKIAFAPDILEKNVQQFLDLCVDAYESSQYFFILEFQHGKSYEYNQLDRSAINIQILQETNGFQFYYNPQYYNFHYDFYRSEISAFHFFFQSYLNVLKINPQNITLFVLEEDNFLANQVIDLMFPVNKKPQKIILYQEIKSYIENNMESLLQKNNFCFDFQQLFSILTYKNQPMNSLYQM